MIYKYKTQGINPKDFRNYQNPIELFKDLKDGNINPKEVLKDQINFKPDLREIKKGNKKSKSEDQISVIQNVHFFYWREKKFDSFKDYYLSYLRLNAKQKMEGVSKNERGLLTPETMKLLRSTKSKITKDENG